MINELKNKIKEANDAYRVGKPIMSDFEYDRLVEELSLLVPDDELLSKVGHEIGDESRKSRLPIEMGSMNKIKSMDDLDDWCRLKNISKSEIVVITPKYDGLSLCVNEFTNEAWTRGNGVIGQKSDSHYQYIGNKLEKNSRVQFTYGEVMMSKKTFIEKYSSEFANPRNLVAGLLNSKEVSEILKDTNFIKYGALTTQEFSTKTEVLQFLNQNQSTKVPYVVSKISDLTEDFLISLFKEFSVEYEIDGLIIEIDNIRLQNQLGRETSSNNPVWARAFKHPSFEQSAETEITGITWNISKQGYLKPTLHVKPIRLDGVTVSNVTGNNARFVKDLGIGVGAKVIVKRSGMVIPTISEVTQPVDFQMPNVPNIDWNENGVELVTLTETDEQKLKKNISFFEILEADNVSEGVITQLWDAGYKTIADILNLKKEDLQKIDRFGKRKAEIVYNSIQKSITGVQLSKVQHATGIFKGLGSKKLALLEHFATKPTLEQVMSIEGFAQISAKSYVDSYDEFFNFVRDLPIKIMEKTETKPTGTDLEGTQFVFTGVRRADLEQIIESRGGKIGSGVSKNTTHLVMKMVGSGSSKERKAIELGVEVITVEQLESLLK